MTRLTTKQLVDKLEMAAHATGQLDGYLMQAARRLEALEHIAVAARVVCPPLRQCGKKSLYLPLGEALKALDDAS